MLDKLFANRQNQSQEYLRPGRLEDVIALIQILGLDPIVHRGDAALQKELCDTPDSAKSWSELAKKHPEKAERGRSRTQLFFIDLGRIIERKGLAADASA